MSKSYECHWVWDVETFPNCFTVQFLHAGMGWLRVFEISDRRNDLEELKTFCRWLIEARQKLVGFNNEGFDYPILHAILHNVAWDAASIYRKSQSIFESQDRFGSAVKKWEVLIPQIDLYKIHHFDNDSKRTSLKVIEFNMRSASVEDLPFDVGIRLDHAQMDELLRYNLHDITETLAFYWKSRPMIEFREELNVKYPKIDFTNFNDTKIGKEYMIMKLEESMPGTCFEINTRIPKQTKRAYIRLDDVILPYIAFDEPEFNRITTWFRQQVITETKGVFKDLSCNVKGMTFVFGTGGLHASVNNRSYEANDEWCILDMDVAGYYPSLGIANRLYPLHLGETFPDHHKDIVMQRREHKKGTAANAMLKLAGNGVYGDSNNPYSPFYDPQYTMGITINGQLSLCMLAEKLMAIPDLQLIQANTDGLTVYCKRAMLHHVSTVMEWWQKLTGLDLEKVMYSRMWVRDCNNYLAESE